MGIKDLETLKQNLESLLACLKSETSAERRQKLILAVQSLIRTLEKGTRHYSLEI